MRSKSVNFARWQSRCCQGGKLTIFGLLAPAGRSRAYQRIDFVNRSAKLTYLTLTRQAERNRRDSRKGAKSAKYKQNYKFATRNPK